MGLMNTKRTVALFAVLALMAVPAWADWDPGQGPKMHYPQLPDPALGELVTGFFEIRSNVAAGVDEEYSHPGEVLWGIGFDTTQENVKMRQYGLGDQGRYEPYFGTVARP